MAKTKTPFFSFGAHGSVGEAITAQKRGKETLVREKPLPTDPYSLPQAYQRWLYEDYAYLWRQQSLATRQSYQSAGVRFHLTGFQYWMKYQLTDLPDLVGLWHLDSASGALVLDYSRNSNHATIFGASPSAGIIDGALYFDRINDYLVVPSPASVPVGNSPRSFATFVYLYDHTAHQAVFFYGTFALRNFWQYYIHTPTGKQAINLFGDNVASDTAVPLNMWSHIAFTWDGTNLIFYLNGINDGTRTFVGAPDTKLTSLYIGAMWDVGPPSTYIKANLDHLRFSDRALDPAEVLRRSERRYPA